MQSSNLQACLTDKTPEDFLLLSDQEWPLVAVAHRGADTEARRAVGNHLEETGEGGGEQGRAVLAGMCAEGIFFESLGQNKQVSRVQEQGRLDQSQPV